MAPADLPVRPDDDVPGIHAFPGNEALARALASALGARLEPVVVTRFPDGEACVRVGEQARGRDAIVVCSLEHADEKILPLVFAAGALHERRASRVGLVAPYLAYMRQDHAFHEGETVSAAHFARLLSGSVDWLVTVEPHLHRIAALDSIYSIPARAVRVSDEIAGWVAREVPNGIIIGPDTESGQWARAVAVAAGLPFVILEKRRISGDRVEVSVPHIEQWRGRTPVLVDDVIATGHTMLETVRHLQEAGTPRPVCVAVHALFAGDAYVELQLAGVARIVTTTTIPHESNAIDVSRSIARAVMTMSR
jgi:ribose-phosphate pyrophosphokinase